MKTLSLCVTHPPAGQCRFYAGGRRISADRYAALTRASVRQDAFLTRIHHGTVRHYKTITLTQ